VLTKRAFSVLLGASEGGLQLASALPAPVWLEHLLPLLTIREAVVLRTTCSAIRDIVADLRVDLDEHQVQDLRAILTCFPKAERITLHEDDPMSQAEEDSLISWLEERENSLILEHWKPTNRFLSTGRFLRRAWRAGIFKSVESAEFDLSFEDDGDRLVQGAISHVKSVDVEISPEAPHVEQAALGYLRNFPALTHICFLMPWEDPEFPDFMPPSLESLTLLSHEIDYEPLLLPGRLSSMIESSGAKLRTLELNLFNLDDEVTAQGLRSLLQACAPTLTHVDLHVESPILASMEVVAGGLASCERLRRVAAPMSTFATPPGIVTAGLVQLLLQWHPGGRQESSDFALWGLMARGDLPSLSWLSLSCEGWRWGADVGPAMAAAFEGVAGTLTDLSFQQADFCGAVDGVDEDGALRQLGEAIGKLRRLETVNLHVGKQGRQYHQIAQAMAEGACPALRSLECGIDSGAAWMSYQPGIVRPSLQHLDVTFGTAAGFWEPRDLAGALTSVGFQGSVVIHLPKKGGQWDEVRELLKSPKWRVKLWG
jgi:hypothetical protein